MFKKNVALLDVDHTLWFEMKDNDNFVRDKNGELVMEMNDALLNPLLKAGIRDVFLFTDMTMNTRKINDRNKVIAELNKRGFRVHGVITPSDIGWQDVTSDDMNHLTGAFSRFQPEESRFAPELACSAEFNSYMIKNARESYIKLDKQQLDSYTLGQAFRDADVSAIEKENISEFTKRYAEEVAFKNKHAHTKGLLLELFIRKIAQKFPWINQVVVADDNAQVIEAVKAYQAHNNSGIPVTLIEIPKEGWRNESIYKTALAKRPANWSFQLKFLIASTSTTTTLLGATLLGVGVAALFINIGVVTALASLAALPVMAVAIGAITLGVGIATLPVVATTGYKALKFFDDKMFKVTEIPLSKDVEASLNSASFEN